MYYLKESQNFHPRKALDFRVYFLIILTKFSFVSLISKAEMLDWHDLRLHMELQMEESTQKCGLCS